MFTLLSLSVLKGREISLLICDKKKGFLEIFLLTDSPIENISPNYRPFSSRKYGATSDALNYILEKTSGRYILILEKGTELLPETYNIILGIDKEKDLAMYYGDFILNNDNLTRLMDYPGDITERFNFGPLRIYRKDKVESVGGFKENLRFAYEYELRLRLEERYGGIYHIPVPLSKWNIEKDETPCDSFSYLRYSKDEEAEYEGVFEEMLKRRGCFLSFDYFPIEDKAQYEIPVSVIIPVLNRKRFIHRAIESVLSQTFSNFELIVVDNGSTDGTREIVAKYVALDRRVHLIENRGGGISFALNTGIKKARGKYIAQLDSDDLYLPETLGVMVNTMEENPNTALAISYYEVIDEYENPIMDIGVIKHLEFNRNNILRTEGAGAVRVWRKKVIQEFGYFDEKGFPDYAEDYDMLLKVAELYRIERVHRVLYKYRQHSESTDRRLSKEYKLSKKALARKFAMERRAKLNLGFSR